MTEIYDEQKHPLSRRIFHWIMALSILIMIGSGWRIYNASPIFPFTFPVWATLGGDVWTALARHGDPGVASAIAWHFAAMWTLFLGSPFCSCCWDWYQDTSGATSSPLARGRS